MKHTFHLVTIVVVLSVTGAQEVTEDQKESSAEEGEGRILGLGHLIRGGHALADAVVGGVVHGSNFAGTRLQQNLFGGIFAPAAPSLGPLSPFQSPYYSPYYAPNFAPGFSPNYAPGFAPNLVPGPLRAPGHRPGYQGTYQPQFQRQDDPYPLNFDGNEFPLQRSSDDYYIHR